MIVLLLLKLLPVVVVMIGGDVDENVDDRSKLVRS
jgi:hypothetical protein